LILKDLGDHLKRRRLDLHLLQAQAAAQIGGHDQTYRHWETGQSAPSLTWWPKIIRFLGYDPRPAAETFAARLKRHRVGLGISRENAARQIGVDAGTLWRWETGQASPEGKHLTKACSFVGEPRPVPVTAAERIRRHRELRGWSQRELAKRLGSSPSTVERWELGQRQPSALSIEKLAGTFGDESLGLSAESRRRPGKVRPG
jgi:transcriptional regulator with XRE-family HTH domain